MMTNFTPIGDGHNGDGRDERLHSHARQPDERKSSARSTSAHQDDQHCCSARRGVAIVAVAME